ncbi:MAG: heme ABC exporter ATP-binding protein CcmA [Chloroflexota bacterium]
MKTEQPSAAPSPGATTGSSMVSVKGLVKAFGDRQALRALELEVAQGEHVVIFGPNGAGKTTLIKVLATIMKPTSGSIRLNGLELGEDVISIRRSIGVVTHQTFLYPHLTADENLRFYAQMYAVPDSRERIREIVAAVGMTARLHDRVGTLSRGMQQRIAIARSLLHRPSLMLLDEPESGLDQQSAPILWEIMQSEGEVRRTTILTTHHLERGLELADRILIMTEGKIVHQALKADMDLKGLKDTYLQMTGERG